MLMLLYISVFCYVELAVMAGVVDKHAAQRPSTNCSIPYECIRTCAAPNPSNCPYTPAETNVDGCECMEGYILSRAGGNCVKIEDCPRDLGCNGDLHAIPTQRPVPCPSTCKSPDATLCDKISEPLGCECVPGYLLSSENGTCVLPENCPDGNPCPANSEFKTCQQNCPQDYCPVDENTDRIVCDPVPRCLSGCVCNENYTKPSIDDHRCIPASDCPPVDCTRHNEVWYSCPSECFSELCRYVEFRKVTLCIELILNCKPKCMCKTDTYRNATGICVPASECPPIDVHY